MTQTLPLVPTTQPTPRPSKADLDQVASWLGATSPRHFRADRCRRCRRATIVGLVIGTVRIDQPALTPLGEVQARLLDLRTYAATRDILDRVDIDLRLARDIRTRPALSEPAIGRPRHDVLAEHLCGLHLDNAPTRIPPVTAFAAIAHDDNPPF